MSDKKVLRKIEIKKTEDFTGRYWTYWENGEELYPDLLRDGVSFKEAEDYIREYYPDDELELSFGGVKNGLPE